MIKITDQNLEISETNKINFFKHVEISNSLFYKKEPCWIWTGFKNKKGYGRVNINKTPRNAHRVSWIIKNGLIKEGFLVLHHCDNPSCVNPKHLFLGTPKDNTQDMLKKGRHNPGDGSWTKTNPEKLARGKKANAKLDWEKVDKIREMYSSGNYSRRELGKIFGVCHNSISDIINNIYWKEEFRQYG